MKKSHKLDEDDTSRKKDKYQYSSQKKDWSVDKMSEGNGFDKEMNLKSYEILRIKKEDSEKVKALNKNYSPIKKEKELIITSMDVIALYPNLRIKSCAEEICKEAWLVNLLHPTRASKK